MTTLQVSPLALGERGEVIPAAVPHCPCGAVASPGQSWVTEWYDRTGLVERWVVTHLCKEHRARIGREP